MFTFVYRDNRFSDIRRLRWTFRNRLGLEENVVNPVISKTSPGYGDVYLDDDVTPAIIIEAKANDVKRGKSWSQGAPHASHNTFVSSPLLASPARHPTLSTMYPDTLLPLGADRQDDPFAPEKLRAMTSVLGLSAVPDDFRLLPPDPEFMLLCIHGRESRCGISCVFMIHRVPS